MRRTVVLAVFLAVFPNAAHAAWSTDPLTNLAIADRTDEQVIPLVASTPDGGAYVAWFDRSSGSYQVFLQRLNAVGEELWPHNGLLVSSHPQDTALFGWDMIADSSGNAVLVFSDIRDGGDLDTFAYRISSSMQFLWGPDGVALSSNANFDAAPRVTEAGDGDFVFVWNRDPSLGDGDVRMQRLSPAGALRFPVGGIPAISSPGEDPGFAILVPSSGGDVIVAWLRNIRSFSSPRHLRAQRFSPTGSPVWASFVTVHDTFPLPIGYFPEMRPDGAGGVVLAWHRSDGTFFSSFVQHLDASGAQLLPPQGLTVSTTAGMHHIGPSPVYDPSTQATYVFWDERNSPQSLRGTYGQRISSGGIREWGNGGIEYFPVNGVFKSLPHAVRVGGDAVVVLVDQPAGADRLVALRIDATGGVQWTSELSTAVSAKSRYPVSSDAYGVTKVVWEDNRGGTIDVYAQNVLADGALGASPVPGSVDTSLRLTKSATIDGAVVLTWGPSCSPGAADYAVYEGAFGDPPLSFSVACSDDGADRTEEIFPEPGNRFFLVVSQGVLTEGSYGTSSQGVERPQAPVLSRCLPARSTAACSP